MEFRPYRPLSERKGRSERQLCRAPPPLPGNDSGSAARPLPTLLITHSHFTSLLCPPAIHVISHFRREGGLRPSGQGEDPGPAEHHAGVDRRAAVLGALQGGQAVTRGPPPQGGARRRRLQSRRLPVCLPLLLSSAPSCPPPLYSATLAFKALDIRNPDPFPWEVRA